MLRKPKKYLELLRVFRFENVLGFYRFFLVETEFFYSFGNLLLYKKIIADIPFGHSDGKEFIKSYRYVFIT